MPSIREMPFYGATSTFKATNNPEIDFLYRYESDAFSAPLSSKADFH